MSTELFFGKVGIGVSHFRLSAVLAAVLAISAMRPQSASAQSCSFCGAVVTSASCTLTKNVGPCTGVAITLSNSLGNTPVHNLNGHRIFGTNPPTPRSVGVELEAFDTVTGGPVISPVNGPGTIARFDNGIVLDFDHNTVTHVHLILNNNGIRSGFAPNTIAANTLKGNSCLGIGSGPTNNPQFGDDITNNFITGSNAPTGSSACPGGGVGIDVSVAAASVQGNVVNHSTTGMHADLGSVVGITVSGNDFSCNSLHGASISNVFGPFTVSGNYFDSNGGDGLKLDNVFDGALIKNNFADGNKAKGIDLVNSPNFPPNATQNLFDGNVALGNAIDLFWDQVGMGNLCSGNPCNHWQNNTFDTSSPSPLP